MSRVLLLLAALSVGCDGLPVNTGDSVHISESFSASEKNSIRVALGKWSRVTNGLASLTETANESDAVVTIVPGSLETGKFGRTHHEPFTQEVVIDLGKVANNPETMVRITLHELGHVWGLEHSGGGIMDPYKWKTQECIDQAAIDELCKWYECTGDERSDCP